MFSTKIKIRFNHCDPAGIVFYPRYCEMLNQVVEEWFENHIGFDFKTLTKEQRAGVPVVSLNVDFLDVSYLGEILTFELSVEEVGISSIRLLVMARGEKSVKLKANMVLAYIENNPEGFKTQPIPEVLRAKILTT